MQKSSQPRDSFFVMSSFVYNEAIFSVDAGFKVIKHKINQIYGDFLRKDGFRDEMCVRTRQERSILFFFY